MSTRTGFCTNFGNCDAADSRQMQEIADGADFVCQECERELTAAARKSQTSRTPLLIGIGAGVALIVIIGLVWLLVGGSDEPPAPTAPPVAQSSPAPPTTAPDRTDPAPAQTPAEPTAASPAASPPPPPLDAPPVQPVETPDTPAATTAVTTAAPTLPAVAPAALTAMLEQGDFTAAAALLPQLNDSDPAAQHLRHAAQTAQPPQIELQYKLANQTATPYQPLPPAGPPLPALSHRDDFRLRLQTPAPLYVYIFLQDHQGRIDAVFPQPAYSAATNPLAAGRPIELPPPQTGWLHVDALPAGASASAAETFFIVSAPWPARDVEALATQVIDTPAAGAQLIQVLEKRAHTGLAGVYFQIVSFSHAP